MCRFFRPNLLDSHMALILLTFIDAGFLEVDPAHLSLASVQRRGVRCSFEAITEIASCDNTVLSIRATLLLANFIRLVSESLLHRMAVMDDRSAMNISLKNKVFFFSHFSWTSPSLMITVSNEGPIILFFFFFSGRESSSLL